MNAAETKRIIETSLQESKKAWHNWIGSTSERARSYATAYDNTFHGQKELAEKLGFDCGCVESYGTHAAAGVRCICIPKKTTRKVRKRKR